MYTQMVGDPTNRPTISVPHTYGDQYVIDGYPSDGGYWNRAAATLNFQKSIENIIIDTTAVGGGFAFSQINWAVAQGTALRNIDFNMAAGSKQTGISMEGGSGGGGSGTFMGDLTFNGGQTGINLSNQQFHIKNVVFNGVTTGIYVDHCFIAVLQGMQFNNCTTGVDAGNANSISLIDSSSSGTDTVVSATKQSPSNTRSIVIENLDATDAQTIVKRSDNGQVLLDGGQGQQTVASFVRGATFDLSFNKNFTGGSLDVNPPQRPSSMLQNGKYTTKQKPTFPDTQAADVVNVRDEGAKGDGSTDDLQALQTAINNNVGKIIYFPYGVYRITDTLNVPAGSILKGEAWPTIRAAGPSAWKDQSNPKAVVQLGSQNGGNAVQFMDFVVEVGHVYEGAKLIEVISEADVFDVVARIGGSQASTALSSQCNDESNPCRAAFMALHITPTGSGYFENVWGWSADHAIDGGGVQAVGSGRGALIESTAPVFFVGVAMEHHVFYAFKTHNAQNVFLGMLQTEGPYWQTKSPAPSTWNVNSAYHDPNFSNCGSGETGCTLQFDLHVDGGSNIFSYGNAFWAIDVVTQTNSVWIKNTPKTSIFYNSNVGGANIQGGGDAFTNIISVPGKGSIPTDQTYSSPMWGNGAVESAFTGFTGA